MPIFKNSGELLFHDSEAFVLTFFLFMSQSLVIYALGVILQDSDTWNAPYR